MPEGYDTGEAPTRRGRRDPELQRALLDDDALVDAQDQDETNSVVYEGLSEGATVISKFTNYRRVGTEEVWSTYGASDHVLPGEDADGAFRGLNRCRYIALSPIDINSSNSRLQCACHQRCHLFSD